MSFYPQVDIGVIGEGFVTFPELLEMIDEGKDSVGTHTGHHIAQIEGDFKLGPMRGLIDDLDLAYQHGTSFLEEVYFKNSEVLYSEEECSRPDALISMHHMVAE